MDALFRRHLLLSPSAIWGTPNDSAGLLVLSGAVVLVGGFVLREFIQDTHALNSL